MANTKPSLEEIRKKYGLNTTSTKSEEEKQNVPALEDIRKKYGLSNNKQATSLEDIRKKYVYKKPEPTQTVQTTATPKLDYSSTVKYLTDNGVTGASGIMTKHEWARRKGNDGGTYQDYLQSQINKVEKRKQIISSLDPKLPTIKELAEATKNTTNKAETSGTTSSAPQPLMTKGPTVEAEKALKNTQKNSSQKVTITSDIPEEKRNARIKEINNELNTLTTKLSGYGRAKVYGTNKYLKEAEEKDRARIAELQEELKKLNGVGTFSEQEQLQKDIANTNREIAKLQKEVSAYGPRPSASVADEWREKTNQLYDAKAELKELKSVAGEKPTGEKILDTAGYVGEKVGRGVIDGLEGITDFVWSVLFASGWALTSGFGLAENKVSDGFLKQYNDVNQNDITDMFGSAEDRYDAAPNAVKEFGWLPETVGNILPIIAETYLTAGGSLVDDALKAGGSVLGAAKNFLLNPQTHFGMSAGGSAIEEAVNKGANPLTATTYGAATGALEVASEMLFGGFAGTDVGGSVIDFTIKNPYLRKAINILTEGIEEDIVAFVDPILQRDIGVDKKAEWATWADYVESGSHGVILSIVMNALGLPLHKYGKSKIVKELNKSSEALNGLVVDDNLKMQPLSNNATEEEITKRKKEITTVALAFDAAVKKAVQTEQQTPTETDSLEKAARDVVERKNTKQPISSVEMVEELSKRGEKLTVEEVQQASGYGDNGAKVLTDLVNNTVGKSFSEVKSDIHLYYEAGLTNKKVELKPGAQQDIYDAGKTDREISKIKATEGIFKNKVFSREESGLITPESKNKGNLNPVAVPKSVSPKMAKALDVVGKALGRKVMFVENIIVNEQGDEANAQMRSNGVFEISVTAEKPLFELIFHEPLHIMRQENTAEYHAFVDFAVQNAELLGYRFELNNSVGTNYERLYSLYESKGLNIEAEGILDEIAARFAERLVSGERDAIDFINKMNQNENTRNALHKYIAIFKDVIAKLKELWNRLIKHGEYSAANEVKNTIVDLEKAKELYEKAYRATQKSVEKRTAEQNANIKTNSTKNLEIQAKEGYNGNVNYSLKDNGEKGEQYGVMWALEKGVLDNNEVSAFYEKISETKNNKYHNYIKVADGQLIYEINDKLVYTDGDYDYPHISKVVTFNTNDKNIIEYGKECVYDGEKYGFSLEDSLEIGSIVYGKEIATITSFGDSETYGRQNGNGEGADSTETYRRSQKDVKSSFSLKDSDYLKAVENGDVKTAQKMVEEAAENAFSNSKVRDENGKLKLVYHGTVNDFTVFDRSFANIEGDFGKGYYFTSNEYDVDANYANEEGPDLKNKIARYAEKLEWEDEYSDLSYGEREEIARQKFITSEPNTITAYLNMENPVYITSDENGTFLDYDEAYDEEYDEYGEPGGLLVEFIEALQNNASDYAYNDVDFSFLYEYAYDNGGVYASDAVKTIKHRIIDELVDENGDLAINEVIRLAFEEIGFDGMIDSSVYYKFRNMNGMDSGTTHYIVFDSKQIKSADVATYDNGGNVIPLSERFNKSNKDIRYSLKNTDLSTKDTKELLDIIAHLKSEFEVTKFAKADPKRLEKMTKDLLKEYSSQADINETVKAIGELYQYIANGEDGYPPVWDALYNRAYGIASNLVEKAVVLDDEQYREYKGLRDYLRKTPMKFNAKYDSVPSGYENFQDFRRRNYGRLNFTKDGIGVDGVYQELATLYPEFFDAEEQINIEDMLGNIVDVLDSIQPAEVNPFSNEMKQTASYLANDIIDRFFDVPQAKPTFADKAERRVVEARVEGGKKVEAVRQQKDAKIKKLIEAQKNKAKKQLDKLRQQRDVKVKKEQEKRREAISKMSETQKAKVLRAQIMRHTSDLSKKLLNPTDNKHIPYELQGAVATLLESINLESNYTYDVKSRSYKKNDEGLPSRRTKAFEALRKLYGDIASSVVVDPDLLGENGLLSDVILLADKRIVDMNSKELETVWNAVRAIEASVNTANKLFSEGKFKTISEVAETLKKDNEGKKGKYYGKGQELVKVNMLTPETFFHYLGDAGDRIFRMMRDAQDKHISIMKEVADFTHKALKDVDVNSLEKTLHTVQLGGEEVQLTTAQLMELYVLKKREQATEHILIGGILPDVVEKKKKLARTEPVRNITIAEILEATSKLTAEQKAIADKLQKFVSTVLSEYGNEASMKVYNYEKFNEKNYWTIRTNKQEIQSDVSKDTAVTSVANKGMAKGTKPHANTSVRIGSIFDTFASHSSDMATYAAWLGASEDVNRIRNFVFWNDGKRTGTVKGILDAVHGLKGSNYIEKLLTDISIGVKGTDNMNPFDKAIGGYKAASVGANLRVIIQQPTALLRALDMIDAQYLTAGAVRPLKGWEKAKKYAPIAQWKDWGYFDINTGRQMKDILFDSASIVEKTKQAGMWGASMADSLAWGQLWNAVEAETKAKHKELEVGSEEFYEAVAKRFTEIVDHTQVVDGILQRSQIMRESGALTKMATSFMGEPTKQYNMAISAFYDAKTSKGKTQKKAVARLGRTAASLAVAGILNACAQSIIDAMRDDDKEKDYWEKWLSAFIGDEDDAVFQKLGNLGDTFNPLTFVPFAKDALSIFQGYDVKRMDTEAISKTYKAAENMYKAIMGTGKYTIAEATATLFAEVGRLYGIPVANVKRDIKSAVMTFAIQTDNYLMQYRMEKAMLDINYSGNSKNFMDILYNAYINDKEAYEFIYNDLLKSGYEADKIQNNMETRLKKAEGVEKTSELSKRYMTPENEKKYDNSLKRVQTSQTWKSANAEQRKNAEADLYSFLTSTGEAMENVRAEARDLGIDETEYTLWQLAKDMANTDGKDGLSAKEKAAAIQKMDLDSNTEWDLYLFNVKENEAKGARYARDKGVDANTYADFIETLYKVDKPTKSGTYGTFTQDEATAAVKMLEGLSQKEKSALWQSVNTTRKKNPF